MSAVLLPSRSTTSERALGPDMVRAVSALLVVYLHACVPYLVHPMPGLVWPVKDFSSGFCDCLYWSIEIFIMPLFLVISGFYAYRSLRQSDGRSFLKSRARRLLSPLLFGLLIVLPLDLYAWMLGLIAEGLMPMAKLMSLKVPSPYGDNLWGLSHLWFLLYVFLYAVVMLGAKQLIRESLPMRLRPLIRRGSAVAIAVIGIVTLVIAPEVVYGFQHAFVPVFSKWLYSGTFFAGGVAIAVFDPNFHTIDRLAKRHFALGVVATIAAVLLGCWTLRLSEIPVATLARVWDSQGEGIRVLANRSDDTHQAGSTILVSISLASMTVLAAWTVALGTIGLANRLAPTISRSERLSRSIQYFAGASFWIYVVHHPFVGLMHIDLKWIAPTIWPVAKSIIVCVSVISLGLVSYEWLIRTSAFGRWIGITSPIKAVAVVPSTKIPAEREPSIRIAA